jgi:hypothetical protein
MSFLLIALIVLFPFGGAAYYRARSVYCRRNGFDGESLHGYH